MSQFSALKKATSLTDLAKLLDIKPGMLSYELYQKPVADRYVCFEISKRSGGSRKILAPNKQLKLIQYRLSLLLEHCTAEIEKSLGHTTPTKNSVAHGFKRQHSIITNARPHVTRRNVFNIDIQDFFGSLNFGRVRGFFIANRHFALNPKVATVLAQISCHENSLPQGSPCSPVISNLIGHTMDMLMIDLAKATGCTYTRYVDDLTFSSNKPHFPSEIAELAGTPLHKWAAGHSILRIFSRSGFKLNEEKTRMQYRDSQQVVTGLTVNRKPNVPATYRNIARAMAHSLFTTGTFYFPTGKKNSDTRETTGNPAGKVSQLIGMLAYIDSVDLANQRQREANHLEPDSTSGRVALFRRVLYFEKFFAPSSPVIVCEGKTDNVYIRCAIKRLAANHPKLANNSTECKLKVHLFSYSERRTQEITEISGGVGGLCKLIKHYHDDTKRFFKAPPPRHPTIILIDNDSGADSIYGAIAGITGEEKPKGFKPFIHVFANLYVVPTPKKEKGAASMIEDFFDQETLEKKLNGKSFDPRKDADNTTSYGKAAFARDVVAKDFNSIEFGGFSEILTRIEAAIDDYAAKHPPSDEIKL